MAGSKKLPAFQFYPGDWRKDPGVQSLDFHDRGVWFEMLCYMHESEERGVLLLNGRPMEEPALARLLGLDAESLTRSVGTLLDYGVASRRESDGALTCRRMVRDEAKRQTAKRNGHDGGNPKLKGGYNKPGFVYAIRRDSDGAVKIGIAVNVENRFRKIKYGDKSDEFTLMGQMAVQDMGSTEANLHKEYECHCVEGEWFDLPANKLESLLTLMGKPKGTGGVNQRASSSSSISSSASTKEEEYPPAADVITGSQSRDLDPQRAEPGQPDEEIMFLAAWEAAEGRARYPHAALTRGRRRRLMEMEHDPSCDWPAALRKFPLECFQGGDRKFLPTVGWFLDDGRVDDILEGKYDWSPNSPGAADRMAALERYGGEDEEVVEVRNYSEGQP